MDEKMEKLEDLGYDQFFESGREKSGPDVFQAARVIAEHKGSYKVKNIEGEYLAKITGKQIFKASSREDYPAVGDWVEISGLGDGKAVIRNILPRRTIIKRKYSNKDEIQIIAANVDVAFVIESVDRDYNLNRLERYSAIAKDGGVEPVVILNKTDLIPEEELDSKMAQIKTRFKDIGIIPTSTLTGSGLDGLAAHIKKGKTYCFLGSSGVGKSSLINKLIGQDTIRTGEIGACSDRGKHTTTAREMYFLENGGIVVDNPGIREVGVTDAGAGLDDLFDEIRVLAKKCKFIDCTHIHEPGCAVLVALGSGELDKDKYSNYIGMRKEIEHFEMTELEKRGKNKQFGKFIKKAKNELKRYAHKGFSD